MAEGVAPANASHSAARTHSAGSEQEPARNGRAPRSLAEIKVSAQQKQFKVSAEGRRKAALVVSSVSLSRNRLRGYVVDCFCGSQILTNTLLLHAQRARQMEEERKHWRSKYEQHVRERSARLRPLRAAIDNLDEQIRLARVKTKDANFKESESVVRLQL